MKSKAKKICSLTCTNPLVRWVFNPLSRDMTIIFMLHRFNEPDYGVVGEHDPDYLDRALTWLKAEGFKFESLSNFLQEGEPEESGFSKRVIFTLDDGYRDQLSVAAPIFAQHNCPATVFLITDFIDGRCWPWDDKIEYILKNSDRDEINITLDKQSLNLSLVGNGLIDAVQQVREFCKKNPGSQLRKFMEILSHEAGVEIPGEAPREYQPLTWDMVHKWEKKGISFGSHGRDHIILSTLKDDDVAAQLDTSLKRLSEEVEFPSTAFCYPTGRFGYDFGPREIHQVHNSEYNAALSSDSGYAHIKGLDDTERYRIRRFAFPDNMHDLIQYCSGFELFKDRVRQLAGSVS